MFHFEGTWIKGPGLVGNAEDFKKRMYADLLQRQKLN